MNIPSAQLYFGFRLSKNADISDLFLSTYNLEKLSHDGINYLAKRVEGEPIKLSDLELLDAHLKSLFVQPISPCELFIKIT